MKATAMLYMRYLASGVLWNREILTYLGDNVWGVIQDVSMPFTPKW